MELVPGGVGEVRQSEVIAALSHALDMTEGHPVGQAERSCLIGMRLAHELRLDEEARYALYYALLLKDVGCSSSAARMCELFGTDDIALKTHGKLVDWTKPAAVARYTSQHVAGGGRIARAQRTLSVLRSLVAEGKAIVETRCDRGAAIVTSLGFPPATADAVRALDEYWDGRGQPFGLAGDAIPLAGAHRLPQPDRRGLLRHARPGRRPGRWCASAAGAGSTRSSPTRCSRSVPTIGSGAISRATTWPRSSASSSRPIASSSSTRTASTASARRSPTSSTRSRPTPRAIRAASRPTRV